MAAVSFPAVPYSSLRCKVLPHSCLILKDPTPLPSIYPAQFKVKLNVTLNGVCIDMIWRGLYTWFR